MKMKFLNNFKLFEANIEENEKVEKLFNALIDSPAMKDIVALKEEVDFPYGTNRSIPLVSEEKPSKKIHSKRVYYVHISDGKLLINFRQNFTPYDATITIKDDVITFKTAEKTASWAGKTKKQIDSAESYFRNLNPLEIKNKYAFLRFDTDTEIGEKIQDLESLKKQAEKWNDKYNAGIVITNKKLDMKKKLINFMNSYNEKIKKERDEAIAKGEKKYVSSGPSDFPILQNFNDLEKCLRWVWAYFISRKISRKLNPKQTFEYLMNNKKFWNKQLPLNTILNQIN